ncbi:14229_t:CDS:1, partial [Cetraspora pellucida]
DFIRAKAMTLQIENFQKSKERNDKKGIFIVKEKTYLAKLDIDNLTATLKTLTINQIKQESSNDNKINKIKSYIRELIKVVKELTNNNSFSLSS